LRTASGLRRFSPMENLRLLGFPPDFRLPPTLSVQVAWRLVGNSLSVPAVRCVLSAIPELAGSGSSYSR
ncbi:MAG: DNA cytosine methyltransferase, partial [Thermoanaerobaculia bacterium]